jgi:hypothetical protein
VHDWLAIAFIPGAARGHAVALAQDYSRYGQLYGPDVQDNGVYIQMEFLALSRRCLNCLPGWLTRIFGRFHAII